MGFRFNGFQIPTDSLTGIPQEFFHEVMPQVKDANLLKICLYILWKADLVGDYQIAFTVNNIMLDKIFLQGLEINEKDHSAVVKKLLELATEMNILLRWRSEKKQNDRYFINCEAGQKALAVARNGSRSSNITLNQIQPNIFKLYEQNIGPLTPLIADTLRDAEATYPSAWIKEAIGIAIENNVRRWRYVETILARWKKEGKNGTDRRHDKTDYRSYLDD